MTILILARSWYAVLGAGALALTAGHVSGAMSGSRFDPPLVLAGLLLGVVAIGAAAWVSSPGLLRRAVSWAGIVGATLPFLWLTWVGLTSALSAIGYAVVPDVIALAAAARMSAARLQEGKIKVPPGAG